MIPSYGWLAHRPDIVRDETWFGIPLRQDPPLPTRWEEFTFARDALASREPGVVLDAACGFEPGVHIMPEIAASLGWHVEAVDLTPPLPTGAFGVGYPEHELIQRWVGDIIKLPYETASIDAYMCISAFEHMAVETRVLALQEAIRVLRLGGIFILTMDWLEPAGYVEALSPGFDFGEEIPFEGEPLNPKVSFLLGVRR